MGGGRIRIVIIEPSVIIRNGLISVLKRLPALNTDLFEVTDFKQIHAQLHKWKPDILIVNPSLLGLFSLHLQEIRNGIEWKKLKCIALQSTLIDHLVLNCYDETITVYDSAEQIRDKLVKQSLLNSDSTDNRQELSVREKEIIICVVKGMTNKQIAEHLCLSPHTVITHRRNIATKLQIHSPAGLTIYAIVNKLVELNDVKDSILPDE